MANTKNSSNASKDAVYARLPLTDRVRVGKRTKAEDAEAVNAQIAAAKAEGHKVVTDKSGKRFIVETLASGMTIRTPVG